MLHQIVALSLIFSCVGLRHVLNTAVNIEVDVVAKTHKNTSGVAVNGYVNQSVKQPSISDCDIPLNHGGPMPQMGLGTYHETTDTGMSGKEHYEKLAELSYQMVKDALSVGYRHIDTAQYYYNEGQVGRAVHDWCEETGTPRENVFITSKLWPSKEVDALIPEALRQGETTDEEIDWDTVRDLIYAGGVASKTALGVDQIDLYLLHAPFYGPVGRVVLWQAMERLLADGHVRSIGVSNWGVQHLKDIAVVEDGPTTVVPAVDQVELHPFLQRKDLEAYCAETGIVLESFSALAQGKKRDNEVVQRIATKHGVSWAQVMIKWNLQHGYVVLAKSTKAERLAENAAAFDLKLSKKDMAALDALDEHFVTGWDPANIWP